MGVYFAPLARVPSPPPSDESALRFALISELSLWIAFALLVFDWLSYLTKETSTVWKSATEVVSCEELPIDRWNQARGGCWQRFKPGKTSISRWFLASRYLALSQAVFFVVASEVGRMSPAACEATRGLPYGFTLAHLPAQFVMILRVWGMCGQSVRILCWLVSGWVVEVAVQLGVNGFVQPVYLALSTSPLHHTCYLAPTSTLFALTFIAPSVLSHVILFISLAKSWQHLHAERVLGTSIIRVLRRDQIFFVLAICLVNFVNVVLVLQQSQKAYRLIFYLPSLCLTHILLTRVYFSLHSRSDHSHSPLQMPPGFNDTTQPGRRPSFVCSLQSAHRRTSNTSHATDSRTVDVHLEPGVDREGETEGEGGGKEESSGSSGSVYLRGGVGRGRMTKREVRELRAAYPHRPSVGEPIGSVTISPAQRSPVTHISPLSCSSHEGSNSSHDHETIDMDSSISSVRLFQNRPSHPTPDRASSYGSTDSVPPALRTAVATHRPSIQRLSRIPVPTLLPPDPAHLPAVGTGGGAERIQGRYFNHHLALPVAAESSEGRAEYRFIPPRRDGVGGPRPRFVPVRPARYRSPDGGGARLGVEGGVGSAAWTKEMFG